MWKETAETWFKVLSRNFPKWLRKTTKPWDWIVSLPRFERTVLFKHYHFGQDVKWVGGYPQIQAYVTRFIGGWLGPSAIWTWYHYGLYWQLRAMKSVQWRSYKSSMNTSKLYKHKFALKKRMFLTHLIFCYRMNNYVFRLFS